MHSFIQFFLDLAVGILDLRERRRRLVTQEAEKLLRQAGVAAFDTAQQVADLARRRGDGRSTDLWLEIAGEIARRESFGRKDRPSL